MHANFDEVHLLIPKSRNIMVAQVLQCLDYKKHNDIFKGGEMINNKTKMSLIEYNRYKK